MRSEWMEDFERETEGWADYLAQLTPFDRAVRTYPAALPIQARVACPKCSAPVGRYCWAGLARGQGLDLIHVERVAAAVLEETPHLEGASSSYWTRHLRERQRQNKSS